jgi:L-seryl-tRNA(Ser) seleniumtransferase
MMAASYEEVSARAANFIERANRGPSGKLQLQMIDGESAIGGGAAPTARLHTALISISHTKLSPNEIEGRFRRHDPPVIARIENDQVLVDLRTVFTSDEADLLDAIIALDRTE